MPEREALEKESDMGAMPASLGATAWGSVALAAAGEDGPARVLRPWGRRGDVRLEPGKDGEPVRRAGKRTELTAQTSLPPGFPLSHPLPPRGWFLFSGCVSCPVVSTSVSPQDLCWTRGHLGTHPIPGPGFRGGQGHGGV